MSLSDLASIASLVSTFAVLISLVFLYFQLRQVTEQVRQAERNQRATIAQVRASRTVELMLRNSEASMADAAAKASRGEADLTETQLQQFLYLTRAVFTNAEDTFIQHRHGLLEDSAYRAFLATFGLGIANPGYRLAWRQSWRFGASKEFAEFVDKLIDGTPARMPPSSADRLAAWKSDLADLSPAASRGEIIA